MGFEFAKETYSGGIKEITLGQGDKAVTVGGESCYPFYNFEGEMPHKPKVAMEIWDMEPEEWPEAALSPFKDVISDPAAWAKKCVDEYGADMVVLQLKSTDPNGNDATWRHFLDCLKTGSRPELSMEAIFEDFAYLDAAYRSLHSGREEKPQPLPGYVAAGHGV